MDKKCFCFHLIINIIVILGLVYLGYLNYPLLMSKNIGINCNEFYFVLASACGLSFIMGMYFLAFLHKKKDKKIKEYQRELERRGIDRDESSSRVKVLESKIEVLEKALKDAISKK